MHQIHVPVRIQIAFLGLLSIKRYHSSEAAVPQNLHEYYENGVSAKECSEEELLCADES